MKNKIKKFACNGVDYLAVEVPIDAWDFGVSNSTLYFDATKSFWECLTKINLPPNNKYSIVGLLKNVLGCIFDDGFDHILTMTKLGFTESQNILILKIEQNG